MNREIPVPPGFWETVRLLLRAARKRAAGRQKRQSELLKNRGGANSTNWGALGTFLTVLFMAGLNIFAAVVVQTAVTSGHRVEVERRGKIVVSRSFFETVQNAASEDPPDGIDRLLSSYGFYYEAKDIVEKRGGSREAIEKKLKNAVQAHGARDLVAEGDLFEPIVFTPVWSFSAMLGSIALLFWGMMLVTQGEGLELDLQRRRHPMWEWLFSHPVSPGAVFLAEMLSPIAANPIYWGAPLFAGFLYGFVYGFAPGVCAAILAGLPITLAAACLGKALEIGIVLRFSARSRGAMLGLMSWLGYSSMMLFFVAQFIMPQLVNALQKFLELLSVLPWPWLGLFLGQRSDGSFSFITGILTCWLASGIMIAGGVWLTTWGAQQGISGNVGRRDLAPAASHKPARNWGKDALYRKEFLWFIRDRSAIVQTILIPATMASVQLFNFRGLLSYAGNAWNYLSGAAILVGTYFLWVLGPRSLSAEGPALWISLTWPRGLESLLKAKAWLWSMISCGIVALVLGYAAYLFPVSIGKIALVGMGWYFFSRSMAEKAVTLVSVPSSSGEPEKIPRGRYWAAQLGMLTFSIGILTQQWQIAIIGIVYSYITAAAMWQNFRARLPFLFDPWSEQLPPAPTLMHAMISISILVEGAAILSGIVLAFTGRENLAIAQALAYGISAMLVSKGVSNFLRGRGVTLQNILYWPRASGALEIQPFPWWRNAWSSKGGVLPSLVIGATSGLLLGLLARGYVIVLQHFPFTAEIIRKSQEQMANVPNLKFSYLVIAVLFAPFAEEYLFRGLLYRALDREWGGWHAVIGSAAFFAIYHPVVAWLPVSLLGVANALVFKKTGRLVPAVILHMVYNAVVLS